MKAVAPIIKYDDRKSVLLRLAFTIKDSLLIEPAARFCLDSPQGLHERLILSIPAVTDLSQVYLSLADTLYHSVFQTYLVAEPSTSHFGISDYTLEGLPNSLLFRELEKLLINLRDRSDMAGRLLKNLKFTTDQAGSEASTGFLDAFLKKGMMIDVGLRFLTKGKKTVPLRIYIPVQTQNRITETLYNNIEQMLLLQYAHADEKNSRPLRLTENLIFNDLELILKRAKEKKNTRRKILFRLNTIELEPGENRNLFGHDDYYDRLNLLENGDRSDCQLSFSLYKSYLDDFTTSKEHRSQTTALADRYIGLLNTLPAPGKEDIAAYTIRPAIPELSESSEKGKSSEIASAVSSWYFNDRAELKPSSQYYSPILSSLNSSARVSRLMEKDETNSLENPRGNPDQHPFAEHPLAAFNYLFRPQIRKPFRVRKNAIKERVFAPHPLEKQYLLYPYRSDYEKYAKTLDIDQKSLHPKVTDFSRRRFARRNQVTHPLNPKPPKNLGRRHSDKIQPPAKNND